MHWTQRINKENAELKAENAQLKTENADLKASAAPVRDGGWHPQVDRKTAERDGLTPDDFQFEHYALSDLKLVTPSAKYPPSILLAYTCNIPKETPQPNQYVERDGKWVSLPDPRGIALASIETQLIDVDTGNLIQEDGRGHIDGKMEGSFSYRIWNKINLDAGKTVRVRLTSVPLFFYLNAEGGANMTYTTMRDGYFRGREIESGVYVLSLDTDGNVSITAERK